MRIAILSFLFLMAVQAIIAQGDIRSVDFKNFTYPANCIGENSENITVKDGEYIKETQEDGYVDRFFFKVFDFAYGDLNGDKAPDAAILGVCNTGGTGNFTEGFVYTLRTGKPRLIARIPGGDRAYGGLREVHVENGLLVVESNEAGEQGGACCPEFVVTTKYRVSGGKLIQSGTALRRPLVPTSRMTFDRGTSGKTIIVEIPAGEAVRYIVGARAGQTLAVSVSSDQTSLRLIEDAEVATGTCSLTAKLPKTGDYTFEIENSSTGNLKITVTVKIR